MFCSFPRRTRMATARQRLGELKASGQTAALAVAQKPLADLEATWGDGMFTSDRWIEVIYEGI